MKSAHDKPAKRGLGKTETAGIAPLAHRVAFGACLALTFILTGAVLFFVVTADHLQRSMVTPRLAAAGASIGTIRRDVDALEEYYRQIDLTTNEQSRIEASLIKATEDVQTARADMLVSAEATDNLIDDYDTIYLRPPLTPRPFHHVEVLAHDASQPATLPSSVLSFGEDVENYFAGYEQDLARLPGSERINVQATFDAFKKRVDPRLDGYLASRNRYDSGALRAQYYGAQLAALERRRAQLDAAIAPKGSLLSNNAYWALCEDFLVFKSLVGERAYSIVLLPRMMLILTLSIFMGILGSLIQLSGEIVQGRSNPGLWSVFSRITLGAGVSLALFFFASAGMLSLAKIRPGDTEAAMSPYLISFLGVMGGFMSDRVLQWMRELSDGVFGRAIPGGLPRWAVGLAQALEGAGVSISSLASVICVSDADVVGWATLQTPVPADKQGLVAAYLRQHPSHIFTDIAPA